MNLAMKGFSLHTMNTVIGVKGDQCDPTQDREDEQNSSGESLCGMRYVPAIGSPLSPNRRRRSNPDFFLLVFRFDWS